MNEQKIIEDLKATFQELYGGEPDGVFFAPGRVNLIGEHTDYNGGHVFPCALSMGTYAAARKREDNRVRLASMNKGKATVEELTLEDANKPKKDRWTDYPIGVIAAFAANGNEIPTGLEVVFFGNVPAGSGLSSSASLEVVMGIVLRTLYGLDDVRQVDLALQGQQAECDYVGMQCGIMDQFASAMGRKDTAMFLDVNTMECEYAPLDLPGMKIVITNSGVKHQLASSEYNVRRAECESALEALKKVKPGLKSLGELSVAEFEEIADHIKDAVERKRAKHAVYENARTVKAFNALKELGNIEEFGRLMNESHDSLQNDYEVSCPEIDFLVKEGRKIEGVIGTRITGGGFGGCTVSIVKDEAIDEFKTRLTEAYEKEFGVTPEFYVAEPGDGAKILEKK